MNTFWESVKGLICVCTGKPYCCGSPDCELIKFMNSEEDKKHKKTSPPEEVRDK